MVNKRYEQIKKAVRILELPDVATMERIKANYRRLMRQWHPDKCNQDPQKCKEMCQQINWAYEIIISYCNKYKYSFKEEDIKSFVSNVYEAEEYEDWWFAKFGNDPIWGSIREK